MQSTNPWTNRDTFIALIVVLIWGINFVPMKIGLETLSPFELGAGRYFLAAVPLCFFFKLPKVRLRWIVATGLIQCVGQFSLLFIALQVGMTAALASILFQTQIYFTALWGFVIYRHRPSKLLLISMSTAFIGLAFFAINALSNPDSKAVTFSGIAFMLAAAAMWGANNIVVRQVQHESPDYSALNFIVWSSAVGALGYLVIVVLFVPDAAKWLHFDTWQAVNLKTWLSVMFVGWVSTLVGYSLWTRLLKHHHANQVAPFSLGVPIIGLVAGIVLLGETINVWQWLGSMFVGVALVLVVFGGKLFPRLIKP